MSSKEWGSGRGQLLDTERRNEKPASGVRIETDTWTEEQEWFCPGSTQITNTVTGCVPGKYPNNKHCDWLRVTRYAHKIHFEKFIFAHLVKKFTHVLRNMKFYDRFPNSLPLDPTLSKLILVHTVRTHSFKIHFNIIIVLRSMPRSLKGKEHLRNWEQRPSPTNHYSTDTKYSRTEIMYNVWRICEKKMQKHLCQSHLLHISFLWIPVCVPFKNYYLCVYLFVYLRLLYWFCEPSLL
jgi:hypothetical protein